MKIIRTQMSDENRYEIMDRNVITTQTNVEIFLEKIVIGNEVEIVEQVFKDRKNFYLIIKFFDDSNRVINKRFVRNKKFLMKLTDIEFKDILSLLEEEINSVVNFNIIIESNRKPRGFWFTECDVSTKVESTSIPVQVQPLPSKETCFIEDIDLEADKVLESLQETNFNEDTFVSKIETADDITSKMLFNNNETQLSDERRQFEERKKQKQALLKGE